MKKNYESVKISFVELSGTDILTMSSNDNDAPDITDWDFA